MVSHKVNEVGSQDINWLMWVNIFANMTKANTKLTIGEGDFEDESNMSISLVACQQKWQL
jgi:hypothetical protein